MHYIKRGPPLLAGLFYFKDWCGYRERSALCHSHQKLLTLSFALEALEQGRQCLKVADH